jgi:hypothetical protein
VVGVSADAAAVASAWPAIEIEIADVGRKLPDLDLDLGTARRDRAGWP